MPTNSITRNEQTRSGDMDDSDEAEEDGFVGADSNGPQVNLSTKMECPRTTTYCLRVLALVTAVPGRAVKY